MAKDYRKGSTICKNCGKKFNYDTKDDVKLEDSYDFEHDISCYIDYVICPFCNFKVIVNSEYC